MAFFGRLGNILKNAAASKRISSELRSSKSIFQAIRCMSSASSSKLFIGGVSYSTDEQSLKKVFSKYGEVIDVRIILDRETGRSRGFGFVTYSSVEEASSAIQALDGQDLDGRRVMVNYANDRTHGYSGGGGYGNAPYGGGYGGNVGGGYGGGGYGSGGNYGSSGGYGNNYGDSPPDSYGAGNAGGSVTNYGNDGGFSSGNTYPLGSSGGYDGNSGNFGVAGGGGGSDNFGNASGFNAAAGVDSQETSAGNAGDLGGFEDSSEGNYWDNDDADNFAKRA